jgi:hypothetical protein
METTKPTGKEKPKRNLFEVSEYIGKMDLMIAKLRTKKPGELVGQVGKSDILSIRREALQQLVDDGYTISQITEAIKNDVFSILPKTLTEILNNTNKKPRAAKTVVNAAKNVKPVAKTTKETKAVTTKAVADAGSISITEDSTDL